MAVVVTVFTNALAATSTSESMSRVVRIGRLDLIRLYRMSYAELP